MLPLGDDHRLVNNAGVGPAHGPALLDRMGETRLTPMRCVRGGSSVLVHGR